MNIITILLIANVLAAVAIIALVLMQQSKSDMGSAFGGGGSQSMFGSRGSANFLSRCTSVMVTVFFLSSLALAYTYAKRNSAEQVVAPISIEESSEVPILNDASDDLPNIDNDSVPQIEAESDVPSLDEALKTVENAAEDAVSEVPTP
jgi:preprotein translocase subunit SecG